MATMPLESSFEDLIQSDLFTFHVGEEKKRFAVHSRAVAATSKYFRALVTNDMAESHTRSAELLDVQPEDFARFLEYAYRRDYTVPSWVQDDDIKGNVSTSLTDEYGVSPPPEDAAIEEDPPMTAEAVAIEEDPPMTPEAVAIEVDSQMAPEDVPFEEDPEMAPEASQKVHPDWPFGSALKQERGKKPPASLAFRLNFEMRNYLLSGDTKASMLSLFKPQPNTSAEQNFTPVFLAHARLYTFAGMRLIEPLRDLALHKLHKTLLLFQPYEQRVGDVIELVQYAYDNGKNRDDDGTIDELRKLVVQYIVCEITAFQKHTSFVALLEEGGEFIGDFWKLLLKNDLIQPLRKLEKWDSKVVPTPWGRGWD